MGTSDRPRAFVPGDFTVPGELVTGDFRLEPLGPQHNAGDYEAWTSSIDHIRATPGFQDISGTPGFGDSTWPDPGMTLEENLADLRRHAADFARRAGFTYTVLAGRGLTRRPQLGLYASLVHLRTGSDGAGDRTERRRGHGRRSLLIFQ